MYKRQELSETIENVRGDIEVWGMEDLGNSYITYRIAAETVPEAHYGVRREIRKALYNMYQEKNYKIPYQKMELENGK